MPSDSQTIQLIIVAAVALAMLLQAIVLLAGLVIVRKMLRSFQEQVEDVRQSVLGITQKIEPVVDNARALFLRSAPKIEATLGDLAALSENLLKETTNVQAAAADAMEKLRRQATRVDAVLTNVFNTVDKASVFVSEAVARPMRQVAGILASVRAVVDTLRSGTVQAPSNGAARTDKNAMP